VAIAALLGLTASGQTPTVDDIVARSLAAKGGVEKLRAVTSVKMTGRIKGPGGEMPVVSYAKRPNMRRRENVSDGQTFILASDGKTVWAVNPLMSTRPREIRPAG
jgi:outer membrane lipoprotein-sorting protein